MKEREEEVGFEPLLLPWQPLAVRCLQWQIICNVNTADSQILVSSLQARGDVEQILRKEGPVN